MTRSKKIFLILSALFIAVMIYFTIDIFSKTTFPGAKKQQPERIEQQVDSLRKDTLSQ
ncbi:hypothetical protein [Rhodocytophaga rosea]|uniref:hypothetical protein n=1 Tax=Rhodocytophaga rosea TaxID=2704465 RepID=UPI001391D1C0|nr:hypothetical protein [Rhodocytophaga rosea]